MWSFGVILYVLLSGCYPFRGYGTSSIYDAIINGHYKLHGKVWDKVSEPAKDLIRALLTLNPAERLTVDDALGHEWIRQSEAELSDRILPENLKAFQIRKRFREMVKLVIANLSTLKTSPEVQKSIAASRQLALPTIGKYKYFTSDLVKKGENNTFSIYGGFHDKWRAEVLLLIYDCLAMTDKQVDEARYEYQLVNTHLQHPNIVRYDKIFTDPDRKKICIVMEYLYGEELYQRIQKRIYYSEKDGRQLAKKMLESIEFMHDKGIIHRYDRKSSLFVFLFH
jgi:serine/threonine protein kinase